MVAANPTTDSVLTFCDAADATRAKGAGLWQPQGGSAEVRPGVDLARDAPTDWVLSRELQRKYAARASANDAPTPHVRAKHKARTGEGGSKPPPPLTLLRASCACFGRRSSELPAVSVYVEGGARRRRGHDVRCSWRLQAH